MEHKEAFTKEQKEVIHNFFQAEKEGKTEGMEDGYFGTFLDTLVVDKEGVRVIRDWSTLSGDHVHSEDVTEEYE